MSGITIQTAEEREAALAEMNRLMDLDPAPGTPEVARLDVLAAQVDAYEDEHSPLRELDEP